MEKKMKNIAVILFSFFIFSCNDVHLIEPEQAKGINVISVKIEPPVVSPGEEVEISADISSGTADEGTADISVGNTVLTASNHATLKIPSDISELFGASVAKQFYANGYVDVPVNLALSETGNSAVKYFRIAGSKYEKTKFDVNPAIESITYQAGNDTDMLSIERYSWIYIQPISVPEEISFEVNGLQLDDLIIDDYAFEWVVTGNADEYPKLVTSDEKTGAAKFSFTDSSGAPVFGDFRFHLVIMPKKSYQGTESARYGADFYTFVISTKGEPLNDEDSDDSSVDDSLVDDSDTIFQ